MVPRLGNHEPKTDVHPLAAVEFFIRVIFVEVYDGKFD
jgi:hypothetical protein